MMVNEALHPVEGIRLRRVPLRSWHGEEGVWSLHRFDNGKGAMVCNNSDIFKVHLVRFKEGLFDFTVLHLLCDNLTEAEAESLLTDIAQGKIT